MDAKQAAFKALKVGCNIYWAALWLFSLSNPVSQDVKGLLEDAENITEGMYNAEYRRQNSRQQQELGEIFEQIKDTRILR